MDNITSTVIGQSAISKNPEIVNNEGTNPWVTRMCVDILNCGETKLPRDITYMLFILEGFSRCRPFCWAGNDTLAEWFGSSECTVRALLRKMEAKGLIRRVMGDSKKAERLAIILMRRSDPTLPVGTPETIPAILRDIEAERIQGQGVSVTTGKRRRAIGSRKAKELADQIQPANSRLADQNQSAVLPLGGENQPATDKLADQIQSAQPIKTNRLTDELADQNSPPNKDEVFSEELPIEKEEIRGREENEISSPRNGILNGRKIVFDSEEDGEEDKAKAIAALRLEPLVKANPELKTPPGSASPPPPPTIASKPRPVVKVLPARPLPPEPVLGHPEAIPAPPVVYPTANPYSKVPPVDRWVYRESPDTRKPGVYPADPIALRKAFGFVVEHFYDKTIALKLDEHSRLYRSDWMLTAIRRWYVEGKAGEVTWGYMVKAMEMWEANGGPPIEHEEIIYDQNLKKYPPSQIPHTPGLSRNSKYYVTPKYVPPPLTPEQIERERFRAEMEALPKEERMRRKRAMMIEAGWIKPSMAS